ncbi:MAG: hypothetical protein IJ443_04410 [Firmicutes bacterium]|nr:hypothetical protein [Bacillota bacterium]
MTSRESKVRDYIKRYEIEVPKELVIEEYEYMCQAMNQKMRYQAMGTGPSLQEMQQEAEQYLDEMKEEAYFSVKMDLVLKEIIARENFAVTREELEVEAEAMAQRQNTSVEMIKSFFGEELAMLETDVKQRKAMDWICGL